MSTLFKNATWGGMSAATRLVFGICNLFLAIKLAGANAYGYFSLILSVSAFYLAFINSFHTISVTKATKFIGANKSKKELSKLFSAVWLVTLVSALTILSASLFFGELFVETFIYSGNDFTLQNQLVRLVLVSTGISIAQLLIAGNISVIEGLGRFDLAARTQVFSPPSTFLILITIFSLNQDTDIIDIALSNLAGMTIELVVTSWARIRIGYRNALFPNRESLSSIPDMLKQGLMLQGANLVNIFFDPFNKFLLNNFAGPSSVTSYEIATKIVAGIRGLFGGACRAFLQLSEKLGTDGSEDYLKVIRFGMVPAILLHGAGCATMVIISHFWLKNEMTELAVFYFLLIPSSIGIIFAAPLYGALIGIRDLAFIFRMHVNLAVMNLIASSLLIPLFGLYGAGVGLTITTAYNALAEYKRYVCKIGPIPGLSAEIKKIKSRFFLALSLTIGALIPTLTPSNGTSILITEGALFIAFATLFLTDPLTRRIWTAVFGKFAKG